MSRAIPIRDLAGKIVGLRAETEEVDPVQATLDASLKAVGATPSAEVKADPNARAKAPTPPSLLTIATGTVIVTVWVVGLVLLAGRSQPTPRVVPLAVPTATSSPTVRPTASSTLTPEPSPTAAQPTPTVVPPTDTLEPPQPAFSPPPAAPAVAPLSFCADKSSLWGKTHQCASTQAAADALADAEIGKVNANGQATATALKATATR